MTSQTSQDLGIAHRLQIVLVKLVSLIIQSALLMKNVVDFSIRVALALKQDTLKNVS